jgi:hypothetical protein
MELMGRLVPTPWIALCVCVFGSTRRLAVRLWPHVEASPTLLWHLSQIDDLNGQPGAWAQRCKHLSQTLTPQMLLDASLKLAPETGRCRDGEVVHFEETILSGLDREGRWRW